ncbi:hypothetical protein GUJ93_ZPchr0006g44827 [Zizania palustris]|uniref:Uncharacterized protein n=1 Tax=Zizania palustris TaxID=103762 RepID=A0A8J5W3A7_ZIZPA|nr:hypothetical protein GUJ93_ZPchr0006g44827 [Zizania palustris]
MFPFGFAEPSESYTFVGHRSMIGADITTLQIVTASELLSTVLSRSDSKTELYNNWSLFIEQSKDLIQKAIPTVVLFSGTEVVVGHWLRSLRYAEFYT